MATYVLLQKVSDTDLEATYDFGPDERTLGRLRLIKGSGVVEILTPAPVENSSIYFLRARAKVLQHWERGELPEATCFAS